MIPGNDRVARAIISSNAREAQAVVGSQGDPILIAGIATRPGKAQRIIGPGNDRIPSAIIGSRSREAEAV